MPIVGITFHSFDARRGSNTKGGEVRVNSTPRITDLKEMQVDTIGKKALVLQFEFVSDYSPDVARISVAGEVLYLAEKPQEVLKLWKKDAALPPEMSVEVLNTLFRRCLLKVANLAEDLQLPPPLDLPRVAPKASPKEPPKKEAK